MAITKKAPWHSGKTKWPIENEAQTTEAASILPSQHADLRRQCTPKQTHTHTHLSGHRLVFIVFIIILGYL